MAFNSQWKLQSFGGFVYPESGPYTDVQTERLKMVNELPTVKTVEEATAALPALPGEKKEGVQRNTMAKLIFDAIPQDGFLLLVESDK